MGNISPVYTCPLSWLTNWFNAFTRSRFTFQSSNAIGQNTIHDTNPNPTNQIKALKCTAVL